MDTLERAFADNQNSWQLTSDGVWRRRTPSPGEKARSLQLELIALHARRAAEDRPRERQEVGLPS